MRVAARFGPDDDPGIGAGSDAVRVAGMTV